MNMVDIDRLSNKVIGFAIDIHKSLGPGLLETAYQQCLAYELHSNKIDFLLEHPIPLKYKNSNIDCVFRADIIIENNIILELKSVEKILPIHEVQLMTYLKLTGLKLGLLINFNSLLLKDGIKRIIL